MNPVESPESIAIIGMAGRFPRAATLAEFWRNLREGREAISFFNEEDVEWLHLDHPPVANDPSFVRARAALEQPEWFDAGFFNVQPKEAGIMDPQQRVFLECAWEALENAGCNPDTFDGSIGVFAGAGVNTYLLNNLLTNRSLLADYGVFPALTLNDKDYLATRVAYKLNLRGPAINVQTACSTSLVAVSFACQSLLSYQCDAALAGGVAIGFPVNRGHHHVEGGIMSRDGHCRTFDARASGTVSGSGAGVVVLKRLADALAAGDRVCAVIQGYAVNNDGAVKMGFTAPSIDGQAECVATALAMASFDPATIGYVETHGTGTPLGDPIEVAALTKAFGTKAGLRGSCAIGSLKTNLGHLDAAAGIAGLIKATLALQHGEIPPSLHFETPNPEIDFAHGPFFVNTRLQSWPPGTTRRRAGVSSFGIGGTNAHVVLEEAPPTAAPGPSRRNQLLVLSARTPSALAAATENLAAHLEQHRELNLADVAFTLQAGRKRFSHRQAWVVANAADAVAALRDPARRLRAPVREGPGKIVFMFPGQGAQSVNMARGRYEHDAGFRRQVEEASVLLRPMLELDLRDVLFPSSQPGSTDDAARPASVESAARLLGQTRLTQPALFVIEYALARRWMQWGIEPDAMIGHSLGEYVAACLAGVFTLPDALALVAERARLMQSLPPGVMLAVRLPESRLPELLDHRISVAAVNAPGACVVTGPADAMAELEQKLEANRIASKRLATSHAFHSSMMEPALPPFTSFLRRLVLRPPSIPWISNVTGTWITPEQATNPDYWARQLRQTVRFADGIATLARSGHETFLEVGPGRTLAGLVRQHPAAVAAGAAVCSSLEHDRGDGADDAAILHALGEIWLAGATPDWRNGFYADECRTIVPLPTYPFERKRHWIEPGSGWASGPAAAGADGTVRREQPTAAEPIASSIAGAAAGDDGVQSLPAIRAILEELSGITLPPEVAEQTFTELGFDSLFLTQACVAIGRRFGTSIAFRQLREELSTPRRLAGHVDRHAGGGKAPVAAATPAGTSAPAPAQPALPVAEADLEIPLTEAQREMWMVSQLGEDAARAYTESATMDVAGSLDADALRRAVRQLAARHEAMRTTFDSRGETQRISPTARIELAFHDCSQEAGLLSSPGEYRPDDTRRNDAAALADRRLERALVEPFDLGAGPLVRALLLRIEPHHHRLAIIVHHIVCDGWSLGILVRELAELYAAEVEGRKPALPAAPRFSLYAEQHSAENRAASLAAAEAYWQEHFADAIPVLDLPTDRPRPAIRSHAGGFVGRQLNPALTAAVKQLAAGQQTTVFTAMLAVFGLLLHRLGGQDDVVVGVPTAAQALEGHPDLVGHFANLLPVRSRIGGRERFTEYLAGVQQTVGRALAHGSYPFMRLLQQLKIPRDPGRVPLTPVLFNTTHHRGTVRFGGAAATLTLQPKRYVNFDLNFNLAITGDTLSFGCFFSRELYDETTVARWCGHLETLLRNVTVNPQAIVTEIPLMTEAERQTMLVDWNAATVEYDRERCIHELFEQQVRRTPEAIALVAGNLRVTYAELNRRADRIAARLRAAGVQPETPVGICLERTPDLPAAMLAVLKAGGAYVPLDPGLPLQRLAYLVSDTRMPLIVTQHSLLATLPEFSARLVLVEEAAAEPATVDGPAPARPAAANLAYIIYTSGSTGAPKGVAVPHRGVTALVAWAREFYRPEELAGVLFATSASFDVSVFECLVPLCLGGRIIIAGNILQLPYLPAAGEVTLVSGVPSAVAELVRTKQIPRSVRTVNLAGEPCPATLVDALYQLPHIERVHDLYGPTETTVYSTGGRRHRGARATIGRPLPNEQVYVLDAREQPVPIGVRGELYIGGDKLARGYLNRPDLTEQRFPTLPWLPGKRLYRTGDVVRYQPDGTLEFLGRMDHQVKLRGYRIEPGEIEAALCQHPRVAEAVALVRPMHAGIDQLVAYVVANDGRALASSELHAHALKWLPGPMVPAAFVCLEQLPRTATGKIDRRALPAPASEPEAVTLAEPRNEIEERLCEIWCEVLGRTSLGVRENFFGMGGHSLHAMQVLARVQAVFEVELTLREFFAAPSVAGLAATLEQALLREPVTAGLKGEPSSAGVPAAADPDVAVLLAAE